MMIGLSLALPAVQRAGGLAFVAPAIGTSWSFATLGIGADGKGTYIVRATLANVGTGTMQFLVGNDDGTTNNAYVLRQNGTGSGGAAVRTTAGVVSATTTGTFIASTEFRFGLAVDGAGGAIASHNGAASVSVTGGPTTGLTTLRVGRNASGALTMDGAIASLMVIPGVALADADLRAAVMAA